MVGRVCLFLAKRERRPEGRMLGLQPLTIMIEKHPLLHEPYAAAQCCYHAFDVQIEPLQLEDPFPHTSVSSLTAAACKNASLTLTELH